MNQVEKVAFNFLKSIYSPNEIVYQKNKQIKFVTADGKKYVVRKVYGTTVWFYSDFFEEMKATKNCHLILVDEKNQVKVLDVSKIKCNTIVDGILIKCVEKRESREVIPVRKDIYKKLIQIRGNRSWDEFFEEVLKMYKQENISYTGLKSEVLAAIGILTLYKKRKAEELKLLEKLIDKKKVSELTDKEKELLGELIKWKLVMIDGTGDSIVCQTVVFGELKMNPTNQELKVYYTPEFCRRYCSLWNRCPLRDKGGMRVWKLPLTDELEELVGKVVLDVCR